MSSLPDTNVQSGYVGYEEAARYLSISEGSLRRYVHLRRLPHRKPFGLKGRTLFVLAELDEFMNRHAVGLEAAG